MAGAGIKQTINYIRGERVRMFFDWAKRGYRIKEPERNYLDDMENLALQEIDSLKDLSVNTYRLFNAIRACPGEHDTKEVFIKIDQIVREAADQIIALAKYEISD